MKLRDGIEREWEIKQILYPDDTILSVASREVLQQVINEFERASGKLIWVKAKYWYSGRIK